MYIVKSFSLAEYEILVKKKEKKRALNLHIILTGNWANKRFSYICCNQLLHCERHLSLCQENKVVENFASIWFIRSFLVIIIVTHSIVEFFFNNQDLWVLKNSHVLYIFGMIYRHFSYSSNFVLCMYSKITLFLFYVRQ